MRLYGKIRKVFMIGIGGSGMSGIAEILHNLGYEVSGSDQNPESESVLQLRSMGIYVAGGHHPQNLGDAQVVVYSSAITPENPELVEARRRGLLVLRRAQMLSELMRMKFGVAVSGSSTCGSGSSAGGGASGSGTDGADSSVGGAGSTVSSDDASASTRSWAGGSMARSSSASPT